MAIALSIAVWQLFEIPLAVLDSESVVKWPLPFRLQSGSSLRFHWLSGTQKRSKSASKMPTARCAVRALHQPLI